MPGHGNKPAPAFELTRDQVKKLFEIPSRNCPLCERGTLKEAHEHMCLSCKYARKLR